MFNYLKGWQRKAGFAISVVVCLLLSGWLRSEYIQDTITFSRRFGSQIQLVSASHYLVVALIDDSAHMNETVKWQTWWTTTRAESMRWQYTSHEKTKTFFGFHDHSFSWDECFVALRSREYPVRIVHLPYWSVVVPLVFLCLLFLIAKVPPPNSESASL